MDHLPSLRAALTASLALALANPAIWAASAVQAGIQSGEMVELLGSFGSGVYVDAAGDWPAYGYRQPLLGRNGGWCVGVETISPVDGAPSFFAAGRLPSDPDGAARILRTPKTIGSFVQSSVLPIAMDGSSIVYLAGEAPLGSSHSSLWRDDQQILTEGTPVANGTALFYFGSQISVRPDGSMLILGIVSEPGSMASQTALVEWPSMNVLLKDGDSIVGVPSPIELDGVFSASADGSHWAIKAEFLVPGSFHGKHVLIVDGAVHEPEPGYPAIWNAPVSPRVASLGAAQTWDGIEQPRVLNNGTVAFYAYGGDPQLGSTWSYYVRNGTVVEVTNPPYGLPYVHGLDPTGAILSTRYPDQLPRLEGAPLLLSSPYVGVDTDFDGVPEAGYIAAPQIFDPYSLPSASGATLSRTVVVDPTGASGFAVVRVRDARIDEVYCNGVSNSTGHGAHLLAAGDRRAGSNEVTLQAYDLPLQSFGYFLASETLGFSANPGGSQGHLCLTGEIGRLIDQVFQSGASGKGAATLDLAAMPQPLGAVPVLSGQTWRFQAWYRDSVQGAATSNFTDAIAVDFD